MQEQEFSVHKTGLVIWITRSLDHKSSSHISTDSTDKVFQGNIPISFSNQA